MSHGTGNGNSLQYSCLGNPMDRGPWQMTVHGVTRVGHNWANWKTTNNSNSSRGAIDRLASGKWCIGFFPHRQKFCQWKAEAITGWSLGKIKNKLLSCKRKEIKQSFFFFFMMVGMVSIKLLIVFRFHWSYLGPIDQGSIQDGRLEGRVLIFCKNYKIATPCWTTINRRMLDPSPQQYPASKGKGEAPKRG